MIPFCNPLYVVRNAGYTRFVSASVAREFMRAGWQIWRYSGDDLRRVHDSI